MRAQETAQRLQTPENATKASAVTDNEQILLLPPPLNISEKKS
jgi:hypothetical protein